MRCLRRLGFCVSLLFISACSAPAPNPPPTFTSIDRHIGLLPGEVLPPADVKTVTAKAVAGTRCAEPGALAFDQGGKPFLLQCAAGAKAGAGRKPLWRIVNPAAVSAQAAVGAGCAQPAALAVDATGALLVCGDTPEPAAGKAAP